MPNTVMNFQVSKKVGNFMTSLTTDSIPTRPLSVELATNYIKLNLQDFIKLV